MNPASRTAERLLTGVVILLASYYLLCFLYISFSSIGYPYSLEWMEGHTFDIVQRILDGQGVYVKPSLEYTPYIYTPFYFYVTAAFSYFFGVDYLAGRLVSILAILGAGGILYRWVWREKHNHLAACTASGLFFATYLLSGRWFDVARIDSLYLFLSTAFLYVFYFYRSRAGAVTAGLLLTLAFFTKQSAILIAIPVLIAGLYTNRHSTFITALTAAASLILLIYAFNTASGGWFNFYIFDVPAGHPFDWRSLIGFWTRDMAKPCAIMFASSIAALYFLYRQNRHTAIFYLALCAGMLGSAYISRLHSFGYINVLMSAHFALALMSGIALAALLEKPWRWRVAALAAAIVQFFLLLYAPAKLIPTQEAVEKGDRFIQEITAIPGDIFTSEIQFIQRRAGKIPYSYGMAMFDVLRADLGDKKPIAQELAGELRQALQDHKFSAVITGRFLRLNGLKKHYRLERKIDNPQEFVSGAVASSAANIFVPLENDNNTGKIPEDTLLPPELNE